MKVAVAFLLMLNLGVAFATSSPLVSSHLSSTSDDNYFCWKDSYGRGVGTIPSSCPSGKPDKDDGLCYEECPRKYNGVGPLCWKGLKAKKRGAGVAADSCANGSDKEAGLCYKACRLTYSGNGPVCWKKCSGFTPTNCGAGCASSTNACVTKVMDMTNAMVKMMMDITALFLTGGSSKLLEASADKVEELVAYQAAYDIARLFSSLGKEEDSYVIYMMSSANKLGTALDSDTLRALYEKASTSEIITLTASMVSTLDPTGLADVVVAFANSSC